MRSWTRFAATLMVLLSLPGAALAQSAATVSEEDRENLRMLAEAAGIEFVDVEHVEKERYKRIRLNPVNERVARYMSAAVEALSDDHPDEALDLLNGLNLERLNSTERAQVYRLIAYAYYNDGDYPNTLEYFNKVLAEEGMSLKDEVPLRFNVVQLHGALEQWDQVIASGLDYLRWDPRPNSNLFYLIAVAHYQLGQITEALFWATLCVDYAPEPKEAWLQLLAALHVQNQDYASAAPVFEELVMNFPKKEYWGQLSLIYGARDQYRSSLAVQQIAYLQGFLTKDDELLRFARSYLYANLPHEAAEVLQQGLADGHIEQDVKAYELLANSLIQAREFEKSIQPLAKAAELSDDGKLYVRLGQVRMQREEWTEAVRMFKRAKQKGGLDNPGFVDLLLGISYYNDQKIAEAKSSFSRARKSEKTRKQADDWLTHIVNETSQS